jgi:hypothetical protein
MDYRKPRTYILEVRIVGDNLLDVLDSDDRNCIETDDQLQLIQWSFAADVPETVRFGYAGRGDVGQHWLPGDGKDTERWFRPPYYKGRAIQMKVSHHTNLSDGEWIYQLHAYDEATGQPYSTIYTRGRTVTVTNPVIINR